MTAAYQLTANPAIVLRTVDNAYIPLSLGNRDSAIYAAWLAAGNHADPYTAPSPSADDQFNSAVASGLEMTWQDSSYLTATYAIDPTTQINVMAEMVSVLANGTFGTGTTTRLWADITGTYHEFNIAQFKLFASAVQLYINELYGVKAELLAGQSASWPSNQVSING